MNNANDNINMNNANNKRNRWIRPPLIVPPPKRFIQSQPPPLPPSYNYNANAHANVNGDVNGNVKKKGKRVLWRRRHEVVYGNEHVQHKPIRWQSAVSKKSNKRKNLKRISPLKIRYNARMSRFGLDNNSKREIRREMGNQSYVFL